MAIALAIAWASSSTVCGCARYESAMALPMRARSTDSARCSTARRITAERVSPTPAATRRSMVSICRELNRVGTAVVIQIAAVAHRRRRAHDAQLAARRRLRHRPGLGIHHRHSPGSLLQLQSRRINNPILPNRRLHDPRSLDRSLQDFVVSDGCFDPGLHGLYYIDILSKSKHLCARIFGILQRPARVTPPPIPVSGSGPGNSRQPPGRRPGYRAGSGFLPAIELGTGSAQERRTTPGDSAARRAQSGAVGAASDGGCSSGNLAGDRVHLPLKGGLVDEEGGLERSGARQRLLLRRPRRAPGRRRPRARSRRRGGRHGRGGGRRAAAPAGSPPRQWR